MERQNIPEDCRSYIQIADNTESALLLAAFSKFAGKSLIEALQNRDKQPTTTWSNMVITSSSERDTRNVIDTITKSLDKSERRIAHAIKCLRRKNLYAKNFQEMVNICQDNNLNATMTALRLMQECLGGIFHNSANPEQFSEKAWEVGIELAMYDNERDRMFSGDLYGPLLYPNITSIYMYTLLASYALDLSEAINTHIQRINMLDAIASHYGGFEKAFADIWQELTKYEDGIETIKKDANRHIADKQRQWEEYRNSLEEDLRKARKELLPLHTRNEILNLQNKELEQKCQEKDKEINRLRDLLNKKEQQISELALQIENDDLPEIASDDIVFVGGHVNMVKKLQQRHPEWRFVDGSEKAFSEFAPPQLLFFWDKHLSHPVYHRAKTMVPPETPIVYLKSTNPEQLEQEMRRGYWANFHQEEQEMNHV